MSNIVQTSRQVPLLTGERFGSQPQAPVTNANNPSSSKLGTSKLAFAVPVIGAGAAVAGVALIVAGWAITWYSNGQNQKDIAQCASQVVDYLSGVKAAAGDFLKDVVIPNKKVIESKLTKLFKNLAGTLSQAPSIGAVQKMVAKEVGAMLGMNPPEVSTPQNARVNAASVVNQPPQRLKAIESFWFNTASQEISKTKPVKGQVGEWAHLTVYAQPKRVGQKSAKVLLWINEVIKVGEQTIQTMLTIAANGGRPPNDDKSGWAKFLGRLAVILGGISFVKFGVLDKIDQHIKRNNEVLPSSVRLVPPDEPFSDTTSMVKQSEELLQHWKLYFQQIPQILRASGVTNAGTLSAWDRKIKLFMKQLIAIQTRLAGRPANDLYGMRDDLQIMVKKRLAPMQSEFSGGGNEISGFPDTYHSAARARLVTDHLVWILNDAVESELKIANRLQSTN